jgi:ubiquinol-cytochrome c reductase cytochrome c subunit
MAMRLVVALSGFLITASVLGAQSPGPAPGAQGTPSGSIEHGKKIYSSYGCYQCHGYEAQGGAGPRLAPRPMLFVAFLKYVRLPTGQMPPYTSKVVSDQELADMYAFLLTIPEPPAVDTIPILAR